MSLCSTVAAWRTSRTKLRVASKGLALGGSLEPALFLELVGSFQSCMSKGV